LSSLFPETALFGYPVEAPELPPLHCHSGNQRIVPVVSKNQFSESDMRQIFEGPAPLSLFMWGSLTYEDAFGTAHRTNFCYVWVGEGKSYTPGPGNAFYLFPWRSTPSTTTPIRTISAHALRRITARPPSHIPP
jgi:hypothetical protein